MSSPYRHDCDAIRERRDSLVRELTDTDAALAKLTTERGDLVRQLHDLEERLAPASARSALDTLRVASPCSADWRTMNGDDRVRLCGACNKNVYDISAMSEAEALAFLAQNDGACVRFYRRADGRVLTSDCPVGVVDKRRRLRILTLTSVPVIAATVVGLDAAANTGVRTGQVVTGQMVLQAPEIARAKPELVQGYVMSSESFRRAQRGKARGARGGGVPSNITERIDRSQPHTITIPDAQLLDGDPPDPLRAAGTRRQSKPE